MPVKKRKNYGRKNLIADSEFPTLPFLQKTSQSSGCHKSFSVLVLVNYILDLMTLFPYLPYF